jgi:hypothetical protein
LVFSFFKYFKLNDKSNLIFKKSTIKYLMMEGVEQDGGTEREAVTHVWATSMDAPPGAAWRVAWLGVMVDVAVRVPRV